MGDRLHESSDDRVYSRYVGSVYRFFYGWVGNREDAEDLTSETLLTIVHDLDQLPPDKSVEAWVFSLSRTVLADHRRGYYRGGALPTFDQGGWEDTTLQGEPLCPISQNERRVRTILEALPDQSRRVLELRFLHDYSVRETAHDLGTTPEQAQVLQRQALAEAVQVAVVLGSPDS